MNAGELRAALASLADSAPVLIEAEPFPLEIKGVEPVITWDTPGEMSHGLMLVPSHWVQYNPQDDEADD